MDKAVQSYKSSTLDVFKEPIQRAVAKLNQMAISDGFDASKNSFRYIFSRISNEWIVLLLVFVKDQKDPKEYIETIPVE
jgi:hypothetical protein